LDVSLAIISLDALWHANDDFMGMWF